MDNKEEKVNDKEKDLCETKIDEMFRILLKLEITKPEAAKVAATINRWLLAILDCHKQDIEVLRKRVEELEKQLAAEKAEKVNNLNTAILQQSMHLQAQNIAYNYMLSNCSSNMETWLNTKMAENICARLGTPTDDYV